MHRIKRSVPAGRLATVAPIVLSLLVLAACSRAEVPSASIAGSKSSAAPRVIQSAHTQNYVPYGFVDERGGSDGFEIAVLRAVDELLPEYEFRFVPTSDEDLFVGLETGRYQLATKGAWSTVERRKKFIFPQEPLAASIIGIAFRSENVDTIHDLNSFAAYSGKLVPISPQSAQYAVVSDYNAAHPEHPITLIPSDVFIINDAYLWVLEGRYDAFFDIKLSFQKNVVAEDGPFHHLASRLAYAPYKGIPTWPLFAKGEEELAEAYDRAMASLKADGTIAELSMKYFGEDVFRFVEEAHP
ncbi:MAG: transporter substrate-binding domain-containing protein [Spirochaetales bacterium]|nr:transporter substrate-binding domain-containing protein [Spirochaetales bacterium]